MTPEEYANDVLYAGSHKIGYDVPFPRVAILAERIVDAIKAATYRERERIIRRLEEVPMAYCQEVADELREDAKKTPN